MVVSVEIWSKGNDKSDSCARSEMGMEYTVFILVLSQQVQQFCFFPLLIKGLRCFQWRLEFARLGFVFPSRGSADLTRSDTIQRRLYASALPVHEIFEPQIRIYFHGYLN